MTVRKVLRRHGLELAPRRSQRSWREFVRQHADRILATDFFTVGLTMQVTASTRPNLL